MKTNPKHLTCRRRCEAGRSPGAAHRCHSQSAIFSDIVHQDLSRERILVSLSGAFAVLALLLTVLGLYGLLSRAVTLRTREIGTFPRWLPITERPE
jgi:hypothetical protein